MASTQRESTQKQDTGEAARSALLRFIDTVGRTEVVIFGMTVALGTWAWLTYVAVPEDRQNIDVFGIVFLGVSTFGALLQVIFLVLVRSPGHSLREKFDNSRGFRVKGGAVVFWGPPLVFAAVFLAVTPPSTSADAIERGWSIYQAIALMVMLCGVCTVIAGLGLFVIVILPILVLLVSILPDRSAAGTMSEAEKAVDVSTRREGICFGVIVLAALGIGISMAFVGSGGSAPKYEAMTNQFLTLVTLRGNAVPSLLIIFFLACIVVSVVVANRDSRGRARSRRR